MCMHIPYVVLIVVEDASAKPTPGIVRGHTDWYGAFSECENAKSVATENGNTIFKGRYCRVWHRIVSYWYNNLFLASEISFREML